MEGEQEQRAPIENWLINTYEGRYRFFCLAKGLDPEDVGSALIYEQAWEEILDAGSLADPFD